MNDADKILDDVFKAELIARRQAERETAYEERIIKRILTSSNLSESGKILAARAKEATGKYKLTFEWFYSEHSDFPVWIATKRIPYVHQLTVAELFKGFLSTKIMEAFEEAQDEKPFPEKYTALVFEWPGIGQMALHDGFVNLSIDNSVKILRQIGKGNKRTILCLQELDPFLDYFATQWAK